MEASNSSLPQGSEDAILQAIKDCANLHQDYKVSGISSEVMQQRLENLVDSWSAILPYINEFNDIGRSHSETFLFWDNIFILGYLSVYGETFTKLYSS